MKQLVTLCLLLGLLLAACQSHRYALPSPQGPPQPKVKKAAKGADDANADGNTTSAEPVEVKIQKNGYTKNGLLKKPKYERRKLKKKVGQRTFLGITLPF